MRTINFLFLATFILIAAVIKFPSFAVAIPLCFMVLALVAVFYLDLEDYKKIKAVDKRIDSLESQLNLLKTTINYKNL